MMYANEHRQECTKRGEQSTMASVTREASALWKEVEDKSKWEALAEEDQERHAD